MSLRRWLEEGRLRPHQTSKREIEDLLAVAERDLSDAQVPDLSTDRRFLIAYEAALTLATIPLYCEGYETHGRGHHWLTFQALPEVMGQEFSDLAEYLDLCRTKRNVSTYDRGGEISQAEMDELLNEVELFLTQVRQWIATNYPALI